VFITGEKYGMHRVSKAKRQVCTTTLLLLTKDASNARSTQPYHGALSRGHARKPSKD